MFRSAACSAPMSKKRGASFDLAFDTFVGAPDP